jgi:hypothetical protein
VSGRSRLAVAATLAVTVGIALATGLTVRDTPRTTPVPAPSVFAGAYRFGNCATSPTSVWDVNQPYGPRIFRQPERTLVAGGRLATYPTRNLTSGAVWFVADEQRPSITLRATRLDRDAPPIEFDAVGRASTEIFPGGWDRGWFYVASAAAAEVLPTPAGCWKVELVGGDPERDVIVVELRGLIPTRQGN